MLAAALIGLHLSTAHTGEHGLQSNTPGLYLQLENGATFGAFRNSFNRRSVYAGYTWTSASGHWSLTAGGTTGYAAATVVPLLAPSARLPLGEGFAARFTYLPRAPRVGRAHAWHLSLEKAL